MPFVCGVVCGLGLVVVFCLAFVSFALATLPLPVTLGIGKLLC